MVRAPLLPRCTLVASLFLMACSGRPAPSGTPADSPGARIGDPAIAAAINAPIMVDPSLGQLSNNDAIRPPPAPDPLSMPSDALGMEVDKVDPATLAHAPAAKGECPRCTAAASALTLAAFAESQGEGAACVAGLRYATGWAERLPATLPLPTGARVVEAAGTDAPGCGLRVVSFSTATPAERVIDWFFTRTRGDGLAFDHGEVHGRHLLAGTRGRRRFAIHAVPRPGGGTDATLLSSD